MALKIPPILQVFITATIMVVLNWLLPGARVNIPLRKGLSLLSFFSGLAIALGGVLTFRRTKTTSNPLHPETTSVLVTTGIYTLTRNPMYLGMACILTALALYLQNIVAGLGVPAFMTYLTTFQIIPEEKILHQLFGAEYHHYCSRVKRWL